MNWIEGKEQNKTKLSTDNFYSYLLKPFQDEKNLIEFIVRRPALQEILKEVLQYKEKWGQMENWNYTKNTIDEGFSVPEQKSHSGVAWRG